MPAASTISQVKLSTPPINPSQVSAVYLTKQAGNGGPPAQPTRYQPIHAP